MSQLKKSLIEDFSYDNAQDSVSQIIILIIYYIGFIENINLQKSKSSYQQIDLNSDKPQKPLVNNDEKKLRRRNDDNYEYQSNLNTLNESICASIVITFK